MAASMPMVQTAMVVNKQRPAGPALQEWHLAGTDHVHDERLAHDGLDEPARLEQLRIVPGAEEVDQQAEGHVVEHRAQGADEQHVPPDVAHVPAARLAA